MPTVRTLGDISFADGRSYRRGEEVTLSPDEAQQAVAGGWAELVTDRGLETPEGSRAKRQSAPERRG